MIQNEKITAIIPARGGSKRLPGKNVKILCGKPLIGYTISAAKESGSFQNVIVTTEDNEIARVSREFGADVIERPAELATDTSKTVDAVFHAIEALEATGTAPGIVALLQPTSPLCMAQDMKNAADIFLKGDCDSVVSVYEPQTTPYWMFKSQGDYLDPLFGWDYLTYRSQDLPPVYQPNGAIYIITVEKLRQYKRFYTERTKPYLMPADRSIDIDTPLDFTITRIIMENNI